MTSKDMEPKHSQVISGQTKELFPDIREPVEFGQLFGVVGMGARLGCRPEVIRQVGLWWLAIKDLGIENTKTNEIKHGIRKTALLATQAGLPVRFIATRSPDFILWFTEHKHAEPRISVRSKLAIDRVSEVRKISERFLPTEATIFLADVALATADDPHNTLSKEKAEILLEENFRALKEAVVSVDDSVSVQRLGEVLHPSGRSLKEAIGLSGETCQAVGLPLSSIDAISIVVRESLDFHRTLGWSEDEVQKRTEKLAKCMATVGQAFHGQKPRPIMLFLESFIKRSTFNNLLLDRRDPLPIICFNDLKR